MSRYEEARLFVLNDAQARLCPALAMEIGFNESIIFLQLEYLIAIKGIVIEGRRWIRMSIRELELEFPFWSIATINRTVLSLIKNSLLDENNFNDRRYDKTRWFAINLEGAGKLKSIAFKRPENDPGQGGPSAPQPVEKEGGHDTRSNQNETGSAQNVTRSNQNDTTIDRELNLKNKSLENTHPHGSNHGSDTAPDEKRVGVCSRFTLEQCQEWARHRAAQPGSRIDDPEAVAFSRYRDGSADEAIEKFLTRTPEEIGEARAATPDDSLTFHEAYQRLRSTMTYDKRGHDAILDEMKLRPGVREQVIAKLTASAGPTSAGEGGEL